MNVIVELKKRNFKIISKIPVVHCKAFEDNAGALELYQLPKLHLRIKHIKCVYHHFREHVCIRNINTLPITN